MGGLRPVPVLVPVLVLAVALHGDPTCTGNTEAGGSDGGGWVQQGDRVDLAQQSLLNKLIRHSLVQNRNQVEVQQRDPNSPLYSVKSFEELRL